MYVLQVLTDRMTLCCSFKYLSEGLQKQLGLLFSQLQQTSLGEFTLLDLCDWGDSQYETNAEPSIPAVLDTFIRTLQLYPHDGEHLQPTLSFNNVAGEPRRQLYDALLLGRRGWEHLLQTSHSEELVYYDSRMTASDTYKITDASDMLNLQSSVTTNRPLLRRSQAGMYLRMLQESVIPLRALSPLEWTPILHALEHRLPPDLATMILAYTTAIRNASTTIPQEALALQEESPLFRRLRRLSKGFRANTRVARDENGLLVQDSGGQTVVRRPHQHYNTGIFPREVWELTLELDLIDTERTVRQRAAAVMRSCVPAFITRLSECLDTQVDPTYILSLIHRVETGGAA